MTNFAEFSLLLSLVQEVQEEPTLIFKISYRNMEKQLSQTERWELVVVTVSHVHDKKQAENSLKIFWGKRIFFIKTIISV